MPNALKLIAGCLLLVACGPDDRQVDPDTTTAAVPVAVDTVPATLGLSGDGVGCFTVGMAVADAGPACPTITDTTVPGPEGTTVRELRTPAADGGLVAWVAGDTVRRVSVTDPRWRTADSLGVGTELDQLLARDGATAIEGEGRLFVTIPSHCGLSFRLDARRGVAVESIDELVRTVLQRNTLVDQVLVIGCPK